MSTTKVLCPVCGASFELPNHEHAVSGVAIGKDSNLGNVYLKVEERMQQLRSNGIDTSKYFSIVNPSGKDVLMKWSGNTPVEVNADDPVLRAIMEAGTLPGRNLFRRWVMSQVFHGLVFKGYGNSSCTGFTEWMHAKGYEYCWSMAEEEYRVQAKLAYRDAENFAERNRWFDKTVAVGMAEDYIGKLQKYVEKSAVRKCKGIPYKRLCGRDIFLKDIDDTILAPMRSLLQKIEEASNAAELYYAFHNFNRNRMKIRNGAKQPSIWCNAYKGSGAFFTLKNLILFHNCVATDDNGTTYSKDDSISFVNRKADEYRNDGWKLFGFMKKLIRDNGIDIESKIAEWRK